ncbi:type I DNA topoisomerase, partial [Stomatohabitans albus]|uniref:type I DNA topoisomerase n=1 Tax=Stomatohabitans albus TaxID=3110766 RepID=UPI00300C480D
MSKRLVIVESPAKARKIGEYLGPEYVVESSVGHIRDLPANASQIPAKVKDKPWATLGVDVDHEFAPVYVVNPDKKKTVTDLKTKLKDCDELLLATDKDREGEAIAWHLQEVLKPKVPVRRMVFGEITKQAIQHAVEHTGELDYQLVDAQEARRILDRLYGYEVSPVLWKKVSTGLSAGRVQSVATRIIVERERERIAFVSANYWDLTAELATTAGSPFESGLVEIAGRRLARGKDFTDRGTLANAELHRLDEAQAKALADGLTGGSFTVLGVETKPYSRKPPAPFATSSLQQEAGRKLRFSAQHTMRVAQTLYENGYITYMRTDSYQLSGEAIASARAQVKEMYGADYLPDKPRQYEKKSKNAQEAHEAIRPAGDQFRTPDQVKNELTAEQFRLYELIWKRTLASQMADAKGNSVQARLTAEATAEANDLAGATCLFTASGRTITFPGFLRAYVEGSDDPDAQLSDKDVILPEMKAGDVFTAKTVRAEGHDTRPPARFTEASLVQKLEELGVGRPSTYASIISTIIARKYVWKKGTALVPSFTAFATTALLEQHFPELVDYAFTAKMEDDLDEIAGGRLDRTPWLSHFYFGDEEPGLKQQVENNLGDIDAATINAFPIGVDDQGRT